MTKPNQRAKEKTWLKEIGERRWRTRLGGNFEEAAGNGKKKM